MTDREPSSRRERRVLERERRHEHDAVCREARMARRAREARNSRLRKFGFTAVVGVVLALGGVLAFGDFLDRPSGSTAADTIDIQSSMAGFTPSDIRVTAGQRVTLNWWTDDAAVHLQNGVHTMVSPDLGLYEELPAEGNRTIAWTVPDKPGTYDVWCETCCGGKDSPSMHGTIIVEPASAAADGGQSLG